MLPRNLIATLIALLTIHLMTASAAWAAPRYKVLHAFGDGQDGAGTYGSLLLDNNGNLYGTTSGGGLYTYGTVFELTPKSNGKWSESVLYNFGKNGGDGCTSTGGLVFNSSGDLYGTSGRCGEYGYGTIFELTPGSGGWTESVLFSFDRTDGGDPYAGVVIDKNGNLYGTAAIVFELTPGSGGWTESVIDNFSRHNDGNGPLAGVILGAKGNLYGTTEFGGKKCDTSTCGTVYELSPLAAGGWKETILFRFDSYDGAWPVAALFMDGSGALYGTTINGGCCGGVVFKLTPKGGGRWKETTLYEFQGGANGFLPGPGVVMDKRGNLYGATDGGGSAQCSCGVVYELSPKKSGKWKYTVLHTFIGSDGAQPAASLILDDKGNLYGTAATAGPYGAGVVFEVTP
jgi:uncharacterized repeat protein (TIGR03803 family)